MSPEAAIAVAGVILSMISMAYAFTRDRGAHHKDLEHRLTAIETRVERLMHDTAGSEQRMTTVETKVEVFWRNVGVDAARILHSPDPALARQDFLLERFMADEITTEQLIELVVKLRNLYDEHDAEPGRRVAAANLMRAIEYRYGLDVGGLDTGLSGHFR